MNDKTIDVTGDSIDDAIESGLAQLGVARTDVSIEVIDEGSPGVLGIGKKEAIVRLALLDGVDAVAPQLELVTEATAVAVGEVEADAVGDEPAPPPTPSSKYDEDEHEPAPTRIITTDADGNIEQGLYFPTEEELEEELAVAKEVIQEVLDVMGLKADDIFHEILPEDERGRLTGILGITGDDLDEVLIGSGGAVLYSLQFVIRGMVSQRLQRHTSFLVDINEFRDRRVLQLISLAKDTADKSVEFVRPLSLDPMPAHERRIIHMALREDGRVVTKSKGEDNKRRVRIIPKNYKPRPYNDRGGYNNRRGGYNNRGGGGGYNNRGGGGGYNNRGGGGGYNNRGGGGGYNNRGGGGGYNNRGGGGGYNNRGGGGGYNNRGGGGGYNDRNRGGYNDPNRRDPNQRDPNQRDPNRRDPNQRDPNRRDPNQRDPNRRDPNERDPNRRDPNERDPNRNDY